ncbi:MAG: HIT domain-containing protein [Porticoccaceae bacterium]
MFELHQRLQADTALIGQLPLCSALLSRDANYPWVILVPRRADIAEIYQLSPEDRQQLLLESCALAEAMETIFQSDKLNIAAIGNLVPQLHLHHVVRYKTDAAWPGPVWGAVEAVAYSDALLQQRLTELRRGLAELLG